VLHAAPCPLLVALPRGRSEVEEPGGDSACDDDRAVTQLDHLVGHATQEKARQIGAAPGAHDDRVRALGLGYVEDGLGGMALGCAISPAPGVDTSGDEVRLDPFDEAVGVRLSLELLATASGYCIFAGVEDQNLAVRLLRDVRSHWYRLGGVV